ncbi:signal peptide protein [Rugosibacter aromaticivorans]|uniref:Signal peptide protein n=1 Tax=Rugosibacter aromaticivorans TaxID=1565605 RepID=A0A0C5JAH8_9PROT|nr:FHA domain-containing protein [Rugosibacter aromaticivorans]AJP48689.1 signal peptide protein [Rugosibacter aromaticivorans]TBR14110.1 MAG: FHA domain-containing protein [Rugosibacter sp.]
MSKLILSIDGAILKEIPLTKERTTIGRKPHNDIQIDNLAISGEHAVIITIYNDSFLEDLNSTNGTFVNGQSIKKHFLQTGDVIALGKYSLKYVNDAVQSPRNNDDFERTMIFRPGTAAMAATMPSSAESYNAADDKFKTPADDMSEQPPAMPAPVSPVAPLPAVTESTAVLPLGAIQILSGNNAGKELELTKNLTTLGKPKVQVAVIARRPQGYFITHVEGASFPVINGTMIGVRAQALRDYDIIDLAGIKMTFFLKS